MDTRHITPEQVLSLMFQQKRRVEDRPPAGAATSLLVPGGLRLVRVGQAPAPPPG
jgi:hypothetical protein